jgi:hypothetical protein
LVTTFEAELMGPKLACICQILEQKPLDEQPLLCITILMFVFSVVNAEIQVRLQAPRPTVGAVLPSRVPPPLSHVLEHLVLNRGRYLTDIPRTILALASPANPPPVPDNGGSRPRGGGGGGAPRAPPANPNGDRILIPENNRPLKAAWAARNWEAGLYAVGSPWHDVEAPGNKRRCMRANHPQVKICLPMALRGECYTNCKGYHGVLTDADVQVICTAGGLAV